MKEFKPNQKYTKSYKTVVAMERAITAKGLEDFRFMVYTFEDGRITPVFILAGDEQHKALQFIHNGFSVVG